MNTQETMTSGDQLFAMYYHQLRSHLLEVAATLDRVQRAGGTDDPRFGRIRNAASVAIDSENERTRRFLESLSE